MYECHTLKLKNIRSLLFSFYEIKAEALVKESLAGLAGLPAFQNVSDIFKIPCASGNGSWGFKQKALNND